MTDDRTATGAVGVGVVLVVIASSYLRFVYESGLFAYEPFVALPGSAMAGVLVGYGVVGLGGVAGRSLLRVGTGVVFGVVGYLTPLAVAGESTPWLTGVVGVPGAVCLAAVGMLLAEFGGRVAQN